jgi:hypothetical protein
VVAKLRLLSALCALIQRSPRGAVQGDEAVTTGSPVRWPSTPATASFGRCFYSPIYSTDGVDCMRTNLKRAHQLSPHYTS